MDGGVGSCGGGGGQYIHEGRVKMRRNVRNGLVQLIPMTLAILLVSISIGAFTSVLPAFLNRCAFFRRTMGMYVSGTKMRRRANSTPAQLFLILGSIQE
jgi:hypothetical protein